jgi:hypothetical protein
MLFELVRGAHQMLTTRLYSMKLSSMKLSITKLYNTLLFAQALLPSAAGLDPTQSTLTEQIAGLHGTAGTSSDEDATIEDLVGEFVSHGNIRSRCYYAVPKKAGGFQKKTARNLSGREYRR